MDEYKVSVELHGKVEEYRFSSRDRAERFIINVDTAATLSGVNKDVVMTKYYPGEVAVIMHKENPLILRAKKAKAEGPDAIEAFKEEVLQEMIEDMKADARRMVHEHILKEGSR